MQLVIGLVMIVKSKEKIMNSKHTFDNFVVDSQNELPYSVATAITKNLLRYNPFFVYGKWRSGKTHLLRAIENTLQEKYKGFYTTGEQFHSDLIKSLQEKRYADFIKQYQNYDVVMIDNIEERTSKCMVDTQKTIMEVIDSLLANNKQVILTSELNPAENLPVMYQHFASHYESGIITDISAPNVVSSKDFVENLIKKA